MKRCNRWIAPVAALILAACEAPDPSKWRRPGHGLTLWNASPEQLATLSEFDLVYASKARLVAPRPVDEDAFRADEREVHRKAVGELERRGTFTTEERRMIDAEQVEIGMRELAMLASWDVQAAARNTVTASGRYSVYAIDEWPNGPRKHRGYYVTVNNGIVTAIQN